MINKKRDPKSELEVQNKRTEGYKIDKIKKRIEQKSSGSDSKNELDIQKVHIESCELKQKNDQSESQIANFLEEMI